MVFNALQRPIEKTHQTIWDVSHDYGRIEWQLTLSIHKKLQRLSTKMSLKKFIRLLGGGVQKYYNELCLVFELRRVFARDICMEFVYMLTVCWKSKGV